MRTVPSRCRRAIRRDTETPATMSPGVATFQPLAMRGQLLTDGGLGSDAWSDEDEAADVGEAPEP